MLYNGNTINTPHYVIELARRQRQNLNASEKALWSHLKNKHLDGYRFRCQHPIFRYILDFYCHQANLAVEIDGDIHRKKIDYDSYRDEFLKSKCVYKSPYRDR